MTIATSSRAADRRPDVHGSTAPHYRGSGMGRQVLVLSGRSLRALRNPALIIPGLLEPILMLTVFSQVFKSVAQASSFPAGVSYIDYLLPAFLISSAVSSGLKSGVALTTELGNGIIARFHAMPIRSASVLIGRSIADTTLSSVNLLVMLVAGTLVFGFDPAGGLLGTAGALLIAVMLSWSLGWVFMAMAGWLRRPEAMQPIGGIVNLVLMFASNAFVPVDSLPGWLRAFASVNPMSHAISAARDLTLDEGGFSSALVPCGLCVALVLVAAPVAVRSFRRAA
ncbi:ABC transporter permease [Streptomyces cinnamoneus]|uniref:ABC transporter permease n=1 Tax=Streptomyces cinnamoneus TaxID=53446 RepID=UPI0033E1D54F